MADLNTVRGYEFDLRIKLQDQTGHPLTFTINGSGAQCATLSAIPGHLSARLEQDLKVLEADQVKAATTAEISRLNGELATMREVCDGLTAALKAQGGDVPDVERKHDSEEPESKPRRKRASMGG